MNNIEPKYSLDRHCRMKRIAMAIKFDHELRLTRRRSPDMQNFEADLSMMVPRPYESILGGKTPKYDFSEVAKNFGRKLAETGSRPDSCGSRELNRRPGRPGEGQGGPNKGHLDPKIGQKNPFHPTMVVKYAYCILSGP